MAEVTIRDISRTASREWTPPIGAMGGPPAHERYRDLVLHAGLRLIRSAEGRPYLAMRDGERRRTFRVPSDELRESLDRFRMRRSMRPLPDQELGEFIRVVEARASDPDIVVPTYDQGDFATRPPREEPSVREPVVSAGVRRPLAATPPAPSGRPGTPDELDAILREVDDLRQPPMAASIVSKAPSAWTDVVEAPDVLTGPGRPAAETISGGRLTAASAEDLPRYVRVLEGLVRGGGWLGTTTELSGLTGDSPDRVFSFIRAYRSDLAERNLVVVPVETKQGWRWMAVDRSRLATSPSDRS